MTAEIRDKLLTLGVGVGAVLLGDLSGFKEAAIGAGGLLSIGMSSQKTLSFDVASMRNGMTNTPHLTNEENAQLDVLLDGLNANHLLNDDALMQAAKNAQTLNNLEANLTDAMFASLRFDGHADSFKAKVKQLIAASFAAICSTPCFQKRLQGNCQSRSKMG